MFLIRSPLGTYLADEGLIGDRFAYWSFERGKARIYSQDEYDAMRSVWPFLKCCQLEAPLALASPTAA